MAGDDDAAPKMEHPQIFVERTLAIVKPDSISKSDEIEDIIIRSGFSILQVMIGYMMMTIIQMPKLNNHTIVFICDKNVG